jgi:transmembrane sensor
MGKENDIDFVSLLQDEKFLQLVKDSSGRENQLDILEREYPRQREAIAYAIEFIRHNISDQKRMPSNDVARIWQNIGRYMGQNIGATKIRYISFKIWKVAAAFIIIFASSVITYRFLTNRDQLEKFAAVKTIVGDEAMIILSDGSKHELGIKDSLIEYRSDGGEVVIKNDKKEEKVENNGSGASNLNQIIVPYGRRRILTLSDGTRVQLNSGSRLIFPAEFIDKKREVYLQGEGYFEVSKNPDKPFTVKTDFVNVKVLGTVFNVSAYEDEKFSTTVLVEGKVVVSQKNKLFGSTEKKLTPGQGCFYSSASFASEIRDVDVYEYVSWRDGIFLFKDKPLINVVNRVEKFYNKKVTIEEEKLANTLVSGKLVMSEDLNEVMDYLAKTLEARFEKKEDGSYIIKELRN